MWLRYLIYNLSIQLKADFFPYQQVILVTWVYAKTVLHCSVITKTQFELKFVNSTIVATTLTALCLHIPKDSSISLSHKTTNCLLLICQIVTEINSNFQITNNQRIVEINLTTYS